MPDSTDTVHSSGTALANNISRKSTRKPDTVETPSTPLGRNLPSTYSTPGSVFGREEDAIVIELTSRYLKIGFEGEVNPQSCHRFTPSDLLRNGDFRRYAPDYVSQRESTTNWGDGYELWRNDIKSLHLNLLGDRLERVLRDVYNKELLVDAGNARMVLVLPSVLPHPVLEAIMQVLFKKFNAPSIALLPASACVLVSAGLRSGLVVDIGWEETTVTTMYELREVKILRSNRGMKLLTKTFAEYLEGRLSQKHRFDLSMIEDVLIRISDATIQNRAADEIEIDWPTNSFIERIALKTEDVRKCITSVCSPVPAEGKPDDDEISVEMLIYKALLSVPQDVRSTCLSRIVFTGEGSRIVGITHTILQRFQLLLSQRGWDPVDIPAIADRRRAIIPSEHERTRPVDATYNDTTLSTDKIVEERYLRDKRKNYQPAVVGICRQVNSMGPWVGASLLTSLKVKSMAEVQRDQFLSHGLVGANRLSEVSVIPQKRLSTLELRSRTAERNSWTLAGFG